MITQDMEEWRDTHHPHYRVSNWGRVMSFAKSSEGRLLKPGLTSAGYPSVAFGRGNTQLVHRLVAAAFIGPCPEGMECRHRDDDRTNARADNLEYGTRQDNVNDMMERGRHNRETMKVIPDADIQSVRSATGTHKTIAKQYGVSRQLIGLIKQGKRRA